MKRPRSPYTEQWIIQKVAEETGMSIPDITVMHNSFIRNMKKAINSAENVVIANFGSFKLKYLGQKTVKNYIAGRDVLVDAHMKITFTAYQDLKRMQYRKLLRRNYTMQKKAEAEAAKNVNCDAEQESDH